MKRIFAGALALLLALAAPALAGNTTFVTSIGDLVFPFTAPTTNPAAPGLIDNVILGSVSPVTMSKCTVTGASPQTCNGQAGKVTTGTLTTAAATTATYTINNSSVTAASGINCQINGGTTIGTGDPVIESCAPGSGAITVTFRNVNAATALSGTLIFGFSIF